MKPEDEWAHFAPSEALTIAPASRLVSWSRLQAGHAVLDVACGTGVVAVTAARLGAKATGLDLSPALLARARENAALAGVPISFHEGNVEKLPFLDNSFDVVLSQFGHMFAPNAALAVAEMLRVLKVGGTLAFSTWPPEMFSGRLFSLVASHLPPGPAGAEPVAAWGDPLVVLQRLGNAVSDVAFNRDVMRGPALSPAHVVKRLSGTSGPVIQLLEHLNGNGEKVRSFEMELASLVSEFTEGNQLHQHFLMTRCTKRSVA